MRKKQLIASIMLLCSIAIAGCGAEKSVNENGAGNVENAETAVQSDGKSITHEWGTYKIEQAPQKVVTLDFSFMDTLTSLGVTPVGNAGVGTTKFPEYLQDQLQATVADVGERKAPNLEVIQSLKPDLIIASVDRHSMIRNELEGIAPTVAFDDVSYDQVMDNVKNIAEILGKQKEAEQVAAGLNEKIAAVKQQITDAPSIVVAGYFDDMFTVWIKDSFVGSLLSQVGAEYAFNGEKSNLEGKGEGVKMTLERLHELNPDFIMLYGDKPDKLLSNPLYQDLKSVKDQHFIVVDRNLWARGRGPIAAGKILDETLANLTGNAVSK
ncbi:ABC transporter substrate-binding protein [Paenibacillus paridis]|uniref:ABC transporter substrate-binding protein n=1 Tax=Paenibacillus paridis TaxID=2583376 RepID=UPI00112238CF|nr:ABC transporter substrate-binding protein [Paenibacillus paridis]